MTSFFSSLRCWSRIVVQDVEINICGNGTVMQINEVAWEQWMPALQNHGKPHRRSGVRRPDCPRWADKARPLSASLSIIWNRGVTLARPETEQEAESCKPGLTTGVWAHFTAGHQVLLERESVTRNITIGIADCSEHWILQAYLNMIWRRLGASW